MLWCDQYEVRGACRIREHGRLLMFWELRIDYFKEVINEQSLETREMIRQTLIEWC